MRGALILGLTALLLTAADLKETLKTPTAPFYKGELAVEKTEDNTFEGTFTLKVEKNDSPVLELLAVDPTDQNKQEVIILYDNGMHGDAIAGDGIYSGTTYIMPGSKQRYYLKNRNDKLNTQVLFEYVLFSW